MFKLNNKKTKEEEKKQRKSVNFCILSDSNTDFKKLELHDIGYSNVLEKKM